jgi:hypothetical protein
VQYLNYHRTTIGFDVSTEVKQQFSPVLAFFRHSLSGAPCRVPQFIVSVTPHSASDSTLEDTEVVTIRRSSAAEFTFTASRVRDAETILYVNPDTTVRLPRRLRPTENLIALGVTEGSIVQSIDLIRDLIIRHEEMQGTIIFHASGVLYEDRVVAIAGRKGAGKTTMLLHLLEKGGVSYFTGDKLFCTGSGPDIWGSPWRDWPYVGVGTLRTVPRLSTLVDESLTENPHTCDPNAKLLLDPDRFERAVGAQFEVASKAITLVVLPKVSPGQRTRISRVTEPEERLARMLQLIDRSCDTSYFPWQSFLVPDYSEVYASVAAARETLSAIDMVMVDGDLDVGIEDLVKVA